MTGAQGVYDAVVVGGGFTGLAAAYELALAGRKVVVLEKDDQPGGMAGSFDVGGVALERFYHHWFTNDVAVSTLVGELGQQDKLLFRETSTGIYRANKIFRLSSPLDLLRFTPLSLPARIQTGLLALRARRVKDWRALEDRTASEWLRTLGGNEAFEVVWGPLLQGKFGPYAEQIGAVWMWNKLKLRGGSRGEKGREVLCYYRGGFAALAKALADKIVSLGGEVRLRASVSSVSCAAPIAGAPSGGGTAALTSARLSTGETLTAKRLHPTTPLPFAADLMEGAAPASYLAELRKIEYLANTCLVLLLKRSLSSTYWLNVSDPDFPYVGVIEHTNFEPPSTYAGTHVVYLSKYLPHTDALYGMTPQQVLDFSLPHIKRMFPDFEASWIADHKVWKERYAQPIVGKHYSKMIPARKTPLANVWLATMAQIYPEDRGTNYAIRDGREVGRELARDLGTAGGVTGARAAS